MSSIEQTAIERARRMFERAFEQHSAGQLDTAIELYQASISIYPTPEAHTHLGWAYGMQNRYEDAIEECTRAIALDPDYGNPYNDIGAYLIAMECWEAAIEWLEKAIHASRYDNRALPYMNLARVYLHFGQDLKALKAFRQAYEADPTHLPALYGYQHLLGKLN